MALGAGCLYPLWPRLAPPDLVNVEPVWWLFGAGFLIAGVVSLRQPADYRRATAVISSLTILATTHVMVLASINDMHPFYGVASVMALIITGFFLHSPTWIAGFGAYAVVLGAFLFMLEPDLRKLAYWGGSLPAIGAGYYRLRAQVLRSAVQVQNQRELEGQVALRTKDLVVANQRLREEIQRREWLEREARVSQKAEALGRMAGGIAHDFSNLITTIGVYAELVASSMAKEAPQQRDLQRIQEAADAATGLIHQLVTVTRNQEIAIEPVDVNEVISDMSDLLGHMLGPEIDLRIDLCDASTVIEGNREQLNQVLLNLILNARDAIETKGRISIETEIRRRDDANLPGFGEATGDFVMLAVSDDGVGMPPEVQSRIFDPFFTTKSVNEGTGLGLSTVFGIVDRLGGQVLVESEPGHGARFETYWPCTAEVGAVASVEHRSPSARGASGRIMLVEDEDGLRSALARVLTQNGYEVIEAADGEAALRAVGEDDHIDLVVSDIVMPRMSGIELVERLSESHPEIGVMLVSGQRSHPSLRDRELPPGVAFLSKPFSPQALAERVGELLNGH